MGSIRDMMELNLRACFRHRSKMDSLSVKTGMKGSGSEILPYGFAVVTRNSILTAPLRVKMCHQNNSAGLWVG